MFSDAYFPRHGNGPLVKAKLVSGDDVEISVSELVGHCHFEGHPGEITRSLLSAHHCLEKQCVFLERYGSNPYWSDRAIAEARKLKSKGAKKEIRRKKKQAAAKEQQMLDALASDIQKTADRLPCALTVVRVTREWPSVFKLYYVSDNRFWDATAFPELTAALQAAYPGRRFLMRHIRAVDGHYVTRTEYLMRKR